MRGLDYGSDEKGTGGTVEPIVEAIDALCVAWQTVGERLSVAAVGNGEPRAQKAYLVARDDAVRARLALKAHVHRLLDVARGAEDATSPEADDDEHEEALTALVERVGRLLQFEDERDEARVGRLIGEARPPARDPEPADAERVEWLEGYGWATIGRDDSPPITAWGEVEAGS
jgi:hypothetical protein